jgi:hypothetical protein
MVLRRWRRVHIHIRFRLGLRFCFRRRRFLLVDYGCVAFALLGWRIHSGCLFLTSCEQAEPEQQTDRFLYHRVCWLVLYGVVAGEGDVSGAAGAAVVSAAGGLVASGVGAAVSVFCSHAARSAAPARMQMILFIVLGLCRDIGAIAES